MLEKFEEMSEKDAKRAFIIYMNFIKVNKEIRKMATCILQEFNIQLKMYFYEVDTKLVEAMKLSIDLKEKQNKNMEEESGSYTPNTQSPSTLSKDFIAAKNDY